MIEGLAVGELVGEYEGRAVGDPVGGLEGDPEMPGSGVQVATGSGLLVSGPLVMGLRCSPECEAYDIPLRVSRAGVGVAPGIPASASRATVVC